MHLRLFLAASAALVLCSCRQSSPSPVADALGPQAQVLAQADGGEKLLRYAIGCALPADRTVASNGTTFPGSLGLAPGWTERALDISEQRWLTACLLARTNRFGVPVVISMRGRAASLADISRVEHLEYTLQEGAFYGNLWADPPRMYVCTGRGDVEVEARLKRVCTAESEAAGVSRCGFRMAGACDAVCADHRADGAVSDCRGGDEIYTEVITTFLKSD